MFALWLWDLLHFFLVRYMAFIASEGLLPTVVWCVTCCCIIHSTFLVSFTLFSCKCWSHYAIGRKVWMKQFFYLNRIFTLSKLLRAGTSRAQDVPARTKMWPSSNLPKTWFLLLKWHPKSQRVLVQSWLQFQSQIALLLVLSEEQTAGCQTSGRPHIFWVLVQDWLHQCCTDQCYTNLDSWEPSSKETSLLKANTHAAILYVVLCLHQLHHNQLCI